MLTPTSEQLAIIKAARETTDNLMISALAGTAKTTTLVMIANALQSQNGLALAFNVKIKLEMEKKFPASWKVMTLNGLGHRAWSKAIGMHCQVDAKKLGRITTSVAKSNSLSKEGWIGVLDLVRSAMQAGIVPKQFPIKGLQPDTDEAWLDLAEDLCLPTNKLISIARKVLAFSIKESFAGVVTFDDQIYMSALFGGVFPRFELVMVDEAQDLSPLNHIQVARAAAKRLIIVGDPKQAIYAFRGADSSSMAKLRELRPNWQEFPLSVTFRCPKLIVARQQQHAPGYTAFSTNPNGIVAIGNKPTIADTEIRFGTTFESQDSKPRCQWSWSHTTEYTNNGEIAVLCRNNAPLIDFAFKLIRQRVGVKMLGRDIGKSLLSLCKKLLPIDETSTELCSNIINKWKSDQVDILRANDHAEKISGVVDRADSLLAVIDGVQPRNAGGLRQEVEKLFARNSGFVTLSTIHKAKGLEWNVVLYLDPWRIPSRWARKAASNGDFVQMTQELNLQYVAETRAKQVLILANLVDFV